jgi:RNA polymerase sigma-70 factor (ECF subfamily)
MERSLQVVIRNRPDNRTTAVSSLAAVMEPVAIPAGRDTSLMRRIAAGDETALARLYDLYSATVFGVARRVLGDANAADDVVQEVFVTVWERPHLFDGTRGTLAAWLGMLAHRRAVDRVRREEASRRRSEAVAAQPPPPSTDLDEAVATLLVGERVRDAVNDLPAEQRACVQLAYFEGRTYIEVAAILGIPEGTAKSRMRLALRRLADTLHAEGISSWR